MNKIYKVIYNKNKHRYEVVSELAKSHGGKCKTTVTTAGDANWLRRLWMRVRGGVNKSDEDGNPVTMSISRAAMVALMCISVWSAAAVSSSWVEGASTDEVPVSVKYDETTGTIKLVKTDPNTNVETIVATYAVGGNISPITSIGTKNPTGIIAIGDQSKAVQSNTIAIGADAHAGDVGGSDDTNGRIAIGTKTVASGNRSIALGNQSTTNDGSYNIAQGNDSIGIGTSTSVFGYSGVSIGRRNIIGIPDPTLVSKDGVLTTKSRTKYSEDDLGGNSVIVGAYNVAYGNRSNVIGTYSRAMGSNSVAIGSGVQSLSDGSIAIGKGSGYEFEEGSRKVGRREKEFYGRDWELPPEYKVLKQVLRTDIAGDKQYEKTGSTWENGGTLPKYNNYGAGSSDPGGFIVEGKNALGIGTYTQVRGDSAIGLATGEMTADLSKKDKSQYARDMRKIMDMEETLYDAKEALKAEANNGDKEALESAVKAAEESLATAKKNFRETYLTKYSFVDGNGALGVGRQILAQGDRSMAVGDYAKAISNDAIAYGGQTLANGTNSMAMGGSAHVGTRDTSFDNSMAIGSHTNVQAGNAVALGAFSEVTGQNSLALGFGKQSGNAITYNSVSGKDSTLIGSYGTVKGNNSILIGSNGNIANDRVVGLGNNINIEAADQNDQENNTAGSVFLGDHAGYVKDSKRSRSLGQVDVVGSAGKMELTESLSSTKGALRDYTKDFIYIYMLERQDDGTQIGAPIAVRSDFAGGDSTVGVVSVGSTYEQQFNNLKDIQDYHTKVGSLITVPVDVTVQVTKNGVPLGEQQQTRYFAADSTREEIYADSTLKEADKEKVWNTIQSKTSTPNTTYTVFETRRIQNVAPGLIGLNSTDAINGSQLFATNQMLGNLVGSLKKTLGDSVTVTEDGQITVAGDIDTLGWIAKADTVGGSNGTVAYDADKKTDETEEAHQARIAKLKEDGYIVDASKVMTFKAGKNIGLVQKPGEFSISTIDTPSFKSVELRGETKVVDGNKVTPVTMLDSNGMQVYTETVTPDGDGTTTTKKVSTTVNNEGVTTDGKVVVNNGKTGDEAKEFVTIDKGTDGSGTDKEYGKIGLDGKNGSNAMITIDRGTKSLTDTANVGTNREQEIGADNPVAGMDRITYTTKGPNDSTINHEVATLDDGFFLTTSKDVANKKAAAGVKLNHTITFTDGANTKVSAVTSDNNGVHSLHIDVNGLPVVYTDKDGNKLTKVGDKFYKDDQFDNGTLKSNATPSNAKNISIVNPDGSISKMDGSAPTTVNNVGSSIGGDVNNGAPAGSTINGEPGNNSFIDKLNTVGGTGNDAISKNAVVTTGDLKNLADTPLFFSGDAADGKEYNGATNTKNTFGRKLSEEAKIVGGVTAPANLTDNNIGVVSNGSDTLTVKLAKNLKDLDSTTYTSDTTATGDAKSSMKVDGNGVRFVDANGDTVDNTPTFTTDGITGGNKTITDVASGIGGKVEDPNKKGANTFLENVNKIGKEEGGQPAADAISEKVVVNAKDLKNLVDTGFKLNTSGQPTDSGASTVKIGDTINVINGVNTKVSAIDDTVEGTHTFHIDVTGMPISYTDNQGNALTKIGDNYYKNTDITNGVPNKDAVAVDPEKVTDNIKVINKDGSTTNPGTISNVKSAIDGVVGNGAPNGSTINGEGGTNTFIDNVNRIGADTNGIDKNSVVTTGDLKNLAGTSLFFSGDAADGKNGNVKNTFGRKLSEEAKIVGGVTTPANLTDNNIGVVSNGSDTLTIKLAKQLTGLDSATYTSPTTKADDGDVTSTMKVDGNGIRFVGDNNAVKTDAPSLTTDGITGGNKQITNVGSGLKDGDKTISMSDLDDSEKWPNTNPIWNNAVNVGDLKKAKDAATTEVTGTGKAIVTKTIGDKDQNIYNVHVDPVVDVVATDGKTPVVRGDDGKYYNQKDIENKTYIPNADGNGGNWYNKSDIGNDGQPKAGAPVQKITPTDVKNNFVNPNGTGSIVLDNVKSGIGGEVKDAAGNNTFIDNINKVGKKNDDGTVAPDAISGNTVVNAKDLKNVVDTGFKLNTSGQGTNPADTVKIGDTIQVVDGKNTTVSAITHPTTGVHEFHIDVTGLPVTYTATETDGEGKPTGTPVDVTKTKDGYQKADGTSLIKINENGKDVYYTADQLDNNVPKPGAKGLTITDNIRLINPKDGTGATKITNVAAGTDDTDAVNVSQLKEMAAGASTEVTGTGKAIVTSKKGDAGQTVYNVHVDPVVEVQSKDGSEVTRGGDGKYYKSRDIADKVYVPNADGNGGNWYNKTDVTDGKPNTGANPQTPEALKQSDIKTSLVNPNAGVDPTSTDNSIILDNVKSGIGGDAGNNGIPKDSTIDGTTGDNSFIKNLDTVGKEGGIDKNTVVNAGDLKNLADTPLFFTGDSADGVPATDGTDKNTFGRKLSQQMKIVGGVDLGLQDSATADQRKEAIAAKLTDGNIGVISDGTDTLTVKLAKELKDLDSVKVSNGKDGKDGKNLVTIGKEVDDKVPAGKDGENGIIGLDGKNGSEAVITIDRGTKSITDEANLGENPSQPVSGTNKSANMDRITYTTKGANGDINHEVATLDDGFMFTTSTDVSNSKAPANVKLNNTIKFTDGANTKVSTVDSRDGVHELHIDVTGLPMTYTATKTDAKGNVVGDPVSVSKVGDTYQDAAGNKLIKVGDKYYRPDQLVDSNVPNPEVKDAEKANGLTITDSISLVNNNGKTIPTTLKNVGSGLKDANGNPTSIDKAVGSNAVNVDDLRTIGKAATTEVTGTGAAEVTKIKGADGQNIYNVHVDKLMTVKPVDTNTKIARGGDGKYYNADDITGKIFVPSENKWYNTADVDENTGKPLKGKTPLDKQPTAVDQNTLKNSVVNPNGNGPTVLDNVKSGIGGEVKDAAGNNTFIDNINKVVKKSDAGTVAAGAISEDTVVNAGDLKNLVDTGFKLNTSGHSGDAQTVKIGETIKVVDGANTKVSDITSKDGVHEFHIDVTGLPMTYTVSQTGGTDAPVSVSKVGDTYQLADGTKLVKVGDKFYKPSQLVDPKADQPQVIPEEVDKDWTVNDSISLVNKEGSKNAPTLKNVGSGLKDANGNDTTLDKAVGSNAVNVDDLRTMGKAATTEVTGTGAAEVTKKTAKDGHDIYNVHVDKLMEAKSTEPGKTIVRGSDNKYYYVDDALKQANDGKWYPADQVGTDGKPADGAVGKDTTELTVVPEDKLKNSLVNPNGNGPTVLDNVKSGIGGEVKDAAGNNTFIDNINKVVKKSDDGTVAPGAISEDTVVNAKDLKNVVDTGFKLNTSGHRGDAQTVKIGETIKVVDGANTKVSDITSEDGVHEFHIDVTGLPMTYVDKDGNPLVKVGDKFYLANDVVNGVPKDNAKPVADENVTSNVTMLDKDGKTVNAPQIRNVGSSLVKDDGERISMKDLNDDTAYPDTNPIWNSAVNVKDLKSAVDAATTEVTTSGVAILSTKTANDGHTIYNVHVDPVIETKGADGSDVVRGDDGKYYKPEKIQNKTYVPNADGNGGNWYNADDVVNGVPKPDAQPQTVKPADIKNSIVNPNSNDPIALDNVKSGIGGEVKDAAGNNTFIDNINKVGKKSDDGTAAPDAISENTVVNAGDLKNLVDTGFKLNTSGHSGDAQTVKIGETIKVVDGANTKVSDITPKDGVYEFHIDVTGLPVTYTATKTDAKGTPTGEPVDVSKVGDGYQLADGTKLVKAGDKYYTPDQLENGKPKPDEEGLTIKESVSLTQDNSAPATLERVGSGRRNGMKANAAPMAWDKILNPPTADDKAKVDNMLTNAANIGDVRDAIKSITDGTSDNASGGFGLTGNNGDVKQDLGKTITVKGGIANKVDEAGQDLHVPEKSTTDQNTYVNVKDVPNADGNGTHKEMVVEIAKDLTDLDSVTVGSVDENGNGGTVINKDGMTVKDATGNNSTSIGTGTIGTSKTDKDGNTSSTNIDGGTITSEKKDKDGNKQSTTIDGSHMTLENKDKDGKLTGPKTEVSNEGMTITPVDKDGNAVTDPKKQVSITDKGLNNGGNQIINVDSGLKDTNGSVKLKDATGDMLNNAVNVGDLKEAINNAQTAVDGDGAAEISKSVDDNGRPTYKVHVDKLVEAKADDGKAIVRGSDNKFYYKDESLQQGTDGKWYAPDQLNPDNTPVEGAVGKATTELTVVPQDKLKTSLVNPNGDGATKLDNIKSAIGGEVKDANGNNTFIDNLNNVGKIGADGKPIIGKDAAVTTGDLKNLADTPLYFSGDRAENATGQNKFDRKLSEETKIVGGAKGELSDNNIGVVSNGKDTLTVKLSKDLKDLNTIEVNDSVSVGKDGDSTVIKGAETTSSFTEVATGPDGQPLYEVDENGEVVRDANGAPVPVTKTSSTTTGGGKLATDVERVEMVDGKPVTSHETTTIDGSHFESKDKDGNYTTINGGEIKSYDKDTNGSVTIKGDSLTASSKDENGHDKVTNISSDGFNSTATTFERDGNGQIVRNPDTGLPKEVTNSTNINSDGFTATRTDSEGNEVLKTTMQNGNIAIEKPQPIIDPTTGEAYKVLDKDGNWVPAHGYTKISDNGFEIQGINQSGTGISKVRLSSEGLDNGGNRITHVAEGIAPDDAVNVSQLRGLTQNINNDIANVGANAAALAGLKAIQYDPLEPTQIMAAVGTYRGKQAAALGIAHYKNEDTMFHMGVSIGSDHTMANIGVTYKFGRTDEKKAVPDRYKAGPISSTYVLQDEMVALKEENARMRANDEKMNAAYDEILNLVKQLKQDNEEMKKKLEKLEKK